MGRLEGNSSAVSALCFPFLTDAIVSIVSMHLLLSHLTRRDCGDNEFPYGKSAFQPFRQLTQRHELHLPCLRSLEG
jgi:hypothetical protein